MLGCVHLKSLAPFFPLLLGFCRPAAASLVAPAVVSSAPSGAVGAPISGIRFVFDRILDPTSFTPTDIVSFTGPSGPIAVTSVSAVPGSANQQFDVLFATQGLTGGYSLTMVPTYA